MKIKTIVLCVALTLISAINIFAQSGRNLSQLTATPTPPPPAEAPKPLNEKSRFITSPNADKYKLVFMKERDGIWFPTERNNKYMQMITLHFDNLIEQMNLAGAQGYRVVSAIGNTATLMQLDEGQYEYQWFDTISRTSNWKLGFEDKHKKLTAQGFRFVDRYLISQPCDIPDDDNRFDNCEYHNFFLYEREKGAKQQPPQQTLITSIPGWGKRPATDLSAQINDSLDAGFVPRAVFSRYEILLEEAKDRDELAREKPDVQVVKGTWTRGETAAKVNALAQQGYRVALADNGVVVLYRHKQDAAPVTYVWLDAIKKNFEKELAKLAAQDARYRTIYPSDDGYERMLIFEVPTAADGKRREYKTLTFDFKKTHDEAKNKFYQDLTAESKETVKTMNKLVKEGFVPRDLFVSGKQMIVGLLLEKQTD